MGSLNIYYGKFGEDPRGGRYYGLLCQKTIIVVNFLLCHLQGRFTPRNLIFFLIDYLEIHETWPPNAKNNGYLTCRKRSSFFKTNFFFM